ncbi:UNVERIFIED_CONTAM: Malate dehydrogenase, mitochondrial [Sesamum radiatum]|uniref:malate dehydrogenase n=1 Tax=Sesamum radiatum TaxID=300843 RepID=A0AAW2LN81_SESRA
MGAMSPNVEPPPFCGVTKQAMASRPPFGEAMSPRLTLGARRLREWKGKLCLKKLVMVPSDEAKVVALDLAVGRQNGDDDICKATSPLALLREGMGGETMKAALLTSLLRRSTAASTSPCLLRRAFSSEAAPERKVAILGAAGGIGQPLSLLMKLNPLVSRLALYDIAGTPGVAADVSHINTRSEVKGYAAEEQLGEALEGSDVVIIPAGVPRKPGMTRDDLFKINAGIVKSLCEAIAKYCPNALVNMISNPVNSTVPIAAEVFKSKGVYDERKLFGVTTLDVVRAKTFYAGKAKVNVADVNVPVIGGHAGITILPLFSQATPKANLSDEDIKALTKRTQDGGTEVVEAKAGKGSATLSMAFGVTQNHLIPIGNSQMRKPFEFLKWSHDLVLKPYSAMYIGIKWVLCDAVGAVASLCYAGAVFADACLKGLNGAPDVVECSFVQSTVTELPFFASKVRLGKNGVEEVLGLGPLSDYEKQGLEALKPELKSSIEKGVAFVRDS